VFASVLVTVISRPPVTVEKRAVAEFDPLENVN
jgi:hypothetical protein